MAYYDKPTQVKFYDPENGDYCAGIAYCGEIICLHCGAVLMIDDFIEDIRKNYDVEPIIDLPWISLNEECLGI